MIEALKKRFKKGDTITLFTSDSSFTGKIEDFEETCIVLETEENVEFIANSSIIRFSAPKSVLKETINSITEIVSNEKSIKEDKKDEILKPITAYKVGEKIPLELLAKVADKKNRIPKVKTKPQKSFKSFGDLEQLISPEEKQRLENEAKLENEKIVSANGVITKFFADRNFGFIVDKFGYEIYFHVSDIIDESLSKLLKSTSIKLQLPVIFTLSKNNKGDKAIVIHKPEKVGVIMEKAKEFSEKKDFNIAIGFIEQILNSYPENKSAKKLKEDLNSKNKPWGFNSTKSKSNDLNYQKAVKAKNIDKNFDSALEYYMLAFENNEKRESCIKDIGMLYVQMQEPQKALDFINKFESELPDDIVTYNYLANLYSSVKEFEKVINYVDLLVDERSVKKDNRKLSMYLAQKGFALIQIKKIDEARSVLEESIGLYPENTYPSRLLQALDEPDTEEQSQIIAAEFDSFGGGFSSFIQFNLNNCEYEGLKESVKLKANFQIEHINQIREDSKKVTEGKPKERAMYLLTEAKLLQEIQPEENEEIRSVLARFCNAMGSWAIYNDYPPDVVRFYYSESFMLENKWDSIIRQFTIYLSSFSSSFPELRKMTAKEIRDIKSHIFPDTIAKLYESKNNVYEGLVNIFVDNTTISTEVSKSIFENKKVLNKFTEYFNISNYSDKEQFDKAINELRKKRKQEISKWQSFIKSIINAINIEELINKLTLISNDSAINWLTQSDKFNLNTISTNILDALHQYQKQTNYRDKESAYLSVKAQINKLIDDIKEKPTKFSYEGFISLLEKTGILLDNSFKAVETASTPKVKVSILGESSIVATDGMVQIKISVENSKDSFPIRNISVSIENTDDIKPERIAEHSDSIDGGEHCELQLKATLSEKVIQDKATTLNVTCSYSYKIQNQDELVTLNNQLSLRLYSEEEFEPISNPYEILANGGPVTDTKMFYGRNEFIARITEAIIQTDSKQVVVYGQKRSGKSSVLYHLKKSLEKTNKTFCVSFSIGDIYDEDITSSKFFYKILSMIQEELENLEFDGKEVPKFVCPAFLEFKSFPNSADFFRKHIRQFKKLCSSLDSWKDKKLVVMIDEFTYLYTAIKNNKISDGFMKQWKAITQNEDSMFSSVLVGQDVFPMFKDEFPNDFGITQDERLTYLSKNDAVRLIEEPIGKTKSGRNRFIGDALDTIIDYTSCNPYYIQIFCARLVSEMNRKKYIEVTSADVKEIADSFINGGQALTDDKFDNLLNAGEEHDIQKYKQEISKEILKNIATNGFCLRRQISISNKDVDIDIDDILKDLVKREVLEQKNDSYKIQVKLFQEWLLKH
jgi:tetratricopeptide (TPR) repeat protein